MNNQPTQPDPEKVEGIPSFEELHAQMADVYQQIEAARAELASASTGKGLAWSIIVAVVILLIFALSGAVIPGIIVGIIGGVIAWSMTTSKPAREYKHLYKEQLIGGFVTRLLEDGKYSPNEGISESLFCNCGLFNTRPDRYRSEDLMSGNIGKTPIFFSEVHAQERYYTTDSKGRRQERWRDIFKGIIFVAEFNKQFDGHTRLLRRQLIKLGGSKTRVRLEDPVFEKIFDTYSTDQIEARYILTPSLMNRLTELDRRFKGKSITLSFLKNNVYIAVKDNVDHFESSLWRKADDPEILRREYDLISSLARIVDDMNLNLRIWKKA